MWVSFHHDVPLLKQKKKNHTSSESAGSIYWTEDAFHNIILSAQKLEWRKPLFPHTMATKLVAFSLFSPPVKCQTFAYVQQGEGLQI